MASTVLVDMLLHELPVVLVGSSHKHFHSGLGGLFGYRTDHIVGFKSCHFQLLDAHGGKHIVKDRYGATNIFGRFGALGFVLLVCFVAKGLALGVESHCQMGGVQPFKQVFQYAQKAIDGTHVLPFGVHQRVLDCRIVCAEDHSVGIY